MMTRKVFRQIVQEAITALENEHIYDALFMIHSLVNEIDDEHLRWEEQEIKRQHEAVMVHALKGSSDNTEETKRLRSWLITFTYELIGHLDARHRLTDQTDFYTICHELGQKTDTPLVRLYSQIVTSSLQTDFDWKRVDQVIEQSDKATQRWLFSAIMLSLWSYFDIEAVKLLAKYATHQARPAAILTMLTFWQARCLDHFYPEAKQIYHELTENDFFSRIAILTEKHIFMSRQSERIIKTLNEDIFPSLLEASKDDRLRMGFEMDDEETDEFERILHQPQEIDPQLKKKRDKMMSDIKQVFSFTEEGFDINATSFMQIKRHSFFDNIANWFKPFDPQDPTVKDIIHDERGHVKSLFKMIALTPGICDIDIYGLIFELAKSKLAESNEMFSFIETKSEEADSVPGADIDKGMMTENEDAINLIRTLFRLCKMSSWKDYLSDIFADEKFTLLGNPLLKDSYRNNAKTIRNRLLLFYKHKDSYRTLLYVRQLAEIEKGYDAELLKIKADIALIEKKFEDALIALQQADVLQPGNKEILLKIDYCCLSMHRFGERLTCLDELEQIQPDDASIIIDKGLCLLSLNRYEEALQQFFHLILLEKNVIPAQRAIAWCNFCLKRYEQSIKYYRTLFKTPSAAGWEDYLHAGHTAWLLDDVQTALTFYHQYMKLYLKEDNTRHNALLPFLEEQELLIKAGKTMYDINIMYDLLTRN